MIARKLVWALAKLDKKSLLRFEEFVASPYFNVNVDLRRFYALLLHSLLKKQKDKWATDEDIWASLYPGTALDKRRLNLLYFNLGKLLDDFLSQSEYDEMLLIQKKVLLYGLQNLKLTKIHNILQKNFIQELNLNQSYSAENAVHQYYMKKSGKHFPMDDEILFGLNLYYILEKLQIYINLLSWKRMYKLDLELHFMEYVFNKIKLNMYFKIPSVQVYTKLTNIINDEEDTDSYYKLRDLMKEHNNNLSMDLQREMYTTVISYCVKKVNLSKFGFDKELFEVYKEFVEKNLVLIDNEMPASDFRNIVLIALRVKEFIWTEGFIEEKKIYINPKFRDNAVYFSLARLEVNRQNYHKVLEYLQLINYDDVWYQLGAKIMQAAAYYKLEEFDALESFLNAFKMYINREKSLTKERKTTHSNFIKYTKKLIYLNPGEKTKVLKLKSEIESNNAVVNKAWLLEMVDEQLNNRVGKSAKHY